jgi:hypothetical protein
MRHFLKVKVTTCPLLFSEYSRAVHLWKASGQENINLEVRKIKFGHTLRKEDGEIPKAALLCNPQGSRKRGSPKNNLTF